MNHGLKPRRLALAALLGATPVGCASEDKIDLGGDIARTGAALSDYSGTWDGYAEAYAFDDKSDRVRLTLDASGQGVIEFGDSSPLAAPDPTDSYPPVDLATERRHVETYAESPFTIKPDSLVIGAGFPYAVSDTTVEDARVRITVSTSQLNDVWCAMQTSVFDVSRVGDIPFYACTLNYAWEPPGSECHVMLPSLELAPIDCGQLSCRWRCDCSVDACTARESEPLSLDGRLENGGDSFAGTLLLGSKRLTVYLERRTEAPREAP